MDELHLARAQRENLALMQGTLPELTDLDDHDLHVREHTRFALGADWRRLKEEMPEMARALHMHIAGHKQLNQPMTGGDTP